MFYILTIRFSSQITFIYKQTKFMPIMKKIKSIVFVQVKESKITFFKSSIEKEQFAATHIDAIFGANHAQEHLYMLIDTDNYGFCLTPKHAVTYNEALTLINMYF